MAKLAQKGFPLNRLNERIHWEIFRNTLEEALIKPTPDDVGGRPRYDVVMMFKALILERYYSLSDDQAEFQINDRLSFQKFLGITLSHRVPDAKSLCLFREELTRKGVIKKLFQRFEKHLRDSGLVGNAGKIVDASFVDIPRQRNNRDDNAIIKSGAVPIEFGKNDGFGWSCQLGIQYGALRTNHEITADVGQKIFLLRKKGKLPLPPLCKRGLLEVPLKFAGLFLLAIVDFFRERILKPCVGLILRTTVSSLSGKTLPSMMRRFWKMQRRTDFLVYSPTSSTCRQRTS
jgi:transposase